MHKIIFGPALVFLVTLILLSACGEMDDSAVTETPLDLTRKEVCMIDGMILLDYPGPKGQLFFKDGEPRFFCDTKGLISTFYNPDYKAKIKHAFVQDFSGREWGSYSDRWVDLKKTFLVLDSSKFGAMGPTIATFSARTDAEAFVAENGGMVLPFSEFDEDKFEGYLMRVRKQLRELTDLTTISGESELPRDDQTRGGDMHIHE